MLWDALDYTELVMTLSGRDVNALPRFIALVVEDVRTPSGR